MTRSTPRLFTLLLAVLATAAAAGEPAAKIVSGPTVTKAAVGYTVSFRVNRPCDVTVRIVNARGDVIRHLASGMVGLLKAAKPFVPQSLSQTIHWDGKDDAGNDAPAGCKVSVAAEVMAKFDKFILWEKDGISGDAQIIPAPNGECYVTNTGSYHTNTTRVFDENGRFVRCLWPYNLNQEGVREFLPNPLHGADDWDGDRVPVSVNHNATYYFGTSLANPAVTTDGFFVGTANWSVGSVGLNCITPEGLPNRNGGWAFDAPGTAVPNMEPTETAQRKLPPWYSGKLTGNRYLWSVAAGEDGDFYLADGRRHVVARFRAKDFVQLPFEGTDKRLIGELDKAVDDEEHFLGPTEIATCQHGNIYVLDGAKMSQWGQVTGMEKARVKVFSKAGTFLRFLPAEQFPRPAIPEGVASAAKNPRALNHPHFLRIDPAGGKLYVKHGRNDRFVQTDVEGEAFRTAVEFPYRHSADHGYHCADFDGNWYVSMRPARGESDELWKLSPGGERLKFGEKDAITIEFDEPARNKTAQADIKGVYVAPSGDIYVVNAVEKWTTPKFLDNDFRYGVLTDKGDQYNATRVDVYGPDGNLKKKNLVRSQGLNDVAVDRDGNIYVIEATMYHGAHQRRYAKKDGPLPFSYLTEQQANLDAETQWNKRFSLTARLMKFSPEGGVRDGEGGRPQLWDYAGVSGLSPQGCGTECPAGQICLDPDERIWVPDTFMYCIKAIDKAGNEIIRVGKYGNEDCSGGGGDKRLEGTNMIIDPEIPLARPSGIAVYRDWLFISDMYAHRVMRCRLDYADKKETALE